MKNKLVCVLIFLVLLSGPVSPIMNSKSIVIYKNARDITDFPILDCNFMLQNFFCYRYCEIYQRNQMNLIDDVGDLILFDTCKFLDETLKQKCDYSVDQIVQLEQNPEQCHNSQKIVPSNEDREHPWLLYIIIGILVALLLFCFLSICSLKNQLIIYGGGNTMNRF